MSLLFATLLAAFVGFTKAQFEGEKRPDTVGVRMQEARPARSLRETGSIAWDVFVVNDWTSLLNAAVMTQDPKKNVRVILNNHIVGNGKALNFRVLGRY